MLFTYFAVPAEFQKRVLMIGILGALVLRAVMIMIGAWLITQFHWVMYVFGAFLLFTGVKMWWAAGQEPDLDNNPALKWINRHMKISPTFDGEKFFTVHNGVKMATPLFVVIILIGIVDIVFAVDSIPAIFAITTDPFIVLTSNVFAILGLRAMYFLLASMHERFHLLSYGLAIILVFIGLPAFPNAKYVFLKVLQYLATNMDSKTLANFSNFSHISSWVQGNCLRW